MKQHEIHPPDWMCVYFYKLEVFNDIAMFVSAGESDVIGSHIPVKAVVGDHVILPCHLEPPFDVKTLTVEWKRNKTHVHTYRHRKDDPSIQAENFKGRTSLFREEMTRGNISLKLTNVSELDAGNYTCHVPKLHSQVKRGNVTLIVGEYSEPDRCQHEISDSFTHLTLFFYRASGQRNRKSV